MDAFTTTTWNGGESVITAAAEGGSKALFERAVNLIGGEVRLLSVCAVLGGGGGGGELGFRYLCHRQASTCGMCSRAPYCVLSLSTTVFIPGWLK